MKKKVLRQSDVIKLISKKYDIKQEIVRNVLRGMTAFLAVALENNEDVILGIGKFSLKVRKPREVHDFKTNKRYMNNPKHKITFHTSKYLQRITRKKDIQLQAMQEQKEQED